MVADGTGKSHRASAKGGAFADRDRSHLAKDDCRDEELHVGSQRRGDESAGWPKCVAGEGGKLRTQEQGEDRRGAASEGVPAYTEAVAG